MRFFYSTTQRLATSIEEILDQPLFLNPHTKVDFNSDNPYFYYIPPRNISDKFATIRDICRFLQPDFISPITFEEKLSLPNANHNRIYQSIIELIPKDWIHSLRTKTSQQSLLNVFYFNKSGTKKSKNLQKLSNKEIYFTLQKNNVNENYNKPFKFISGQIILKGIVFSALKPGARFFLTGSKDARMAIYFQYGTSLFISPYL